MYSKTVNFYEEYLFLTIPFFTFKLRLHDFVSIGYSVQFGQKFVIKTFRLKAAVFKAFEFDITNGNTVFKYDQFYRLIWSLSDIYDENFL